MLWKRSLHCIRNGVLCYGKGACIALETEFYAMEKGAWIASETEYYAMEKEFALH